MNNKPEIPKFNDSNFPNIFIQKPLKTTSPISSDLPSKFGSDSLNSNANSITARYMPQSMFSNTSSINNPMLPNLSETSSDQGLMNKGLMNRSQKSLYSNTSSQVPPENMILSATSDANPLYSQTSPIINTPNVLDSETSPDMPQTNIKENIGTNKPNFKNMTLYFTQPDTEVSWYDRKEQSNSILFGDLADFFGMSNAVKPLPVVCDINKAAEVAQKICKYALYINDPIKRETLIKEFKADKQIFDGLESSVESGKYAFPIFGSVIFALKFIEEPSTINLGTINKNNYKLLTEKSDYDLVFYNVSWDDKNTNNCRAVIFNTNKIQVTDIYLKQSECAIGGAKGLAMLKLLNGSSNETRFDTKYIKLLEHLYNNGHVNLKTYQENNK